MGLGLGDNNETTMKFVPLLDVANSLPPHGAGGDMGSVSEVCNLGSCFSFGDEKHEDSYTPGGRRLEVRAAHAAPPGGECLVSYGKNGNLKNIPGFVV